MPFCLPHVGRDVACEPTGTRIGDSHPGGATTETRRERVPNGISQRVVDQYLGLFADVCTITKPFYEQFPQDRGVQVRRRLLGARRLFLHVGREAWGGRGRIWVGHRQPQTRVGLLFTAGRTRPSQTTLLRYVFPENATEHRQHRERVASPYAGLVIRLHGQVRVQIIKRSRTRDLLESATAVLRALFVFSRARQQTARKHGTLDQSNDWNQFRRAL